MLKKILVFQHTPWEGPGKYLVDAASKCEVKLKVCKVWQQPIPEISAYDGLLLLGGGPNIDQEKQYPFLKAEKEVIRKAIAEDLPCLGICLGHQLLADAFGARVAGNFCSSVGFVNGYLTHEGREHPVFAGLPKKLSLFKWHGQSVQEPLPNTLAVLATSADCQVEAISVRDRPHILGIQFDNHAADPQDVAKWLSKDSKWLASLPDVDPDPAAILSDAKRLSESIASEFEQFFRNYIELIHAKEREIIPLDRFTAGI